MIVGQDHIPARRPDAHRLLLRALLDRLPQAGVVATSSTPWASLTFSGSRHAVALTLPSPAVAHAFAREAGEMEFVLRGHIVADVTAYAGEDGRLVVEALTVEDA